MFRLVRRTALASVLPLVAAAAVSAQAGAGTLAAPASSCSSNSYAYAGLVAARAGYGIKATLTALAPAQVRQGHVAGWIGVGSPTAGPGGTAEWLQTGLNQLADGTSELYAELTLPSSGTRYKTILSTVTPGHGYRLAVLQLPGSPNTWQVWLDGKPVSKAVNLPGSSSFQQMAMTESWNGGTPACNGYAYSFQGLLVASKPGSWHPLGADASKLSDAGYRIADRTGNGFVGQSG